MLILKIIAIVLLVLLAFILTGLLLVLFAPVRYYGKFTTKGDVFKTLDFERINFVLDVYWFFKLVHLRLELRKMKLNLFLRAGWIKLIEKGKIQGLISGDEEDEGSQPEVAQSEESKTRRSKKERRKIGRLKRIRRKSRGVQGEEAQTASAGIAEIQAGKAQKERPQADSAEIVKSDTCEPDSAGLQTARVETAGQQNDKSQAEGVKDDNAGSEKIQADKTENERPQTGSAGIAEPKTTSPESTESKTASAESAGPKPDLIAAVKDKLNPENKPVHDEDDDGSDLFDELKEGLRRLKNRAVSMARKAYDGFIQTKQQAAERVQGVLQMSTEQGQNLPQQIFDLLYDAYLWIDGKVDDLDRQVEKLQDKKEKQETFFGWTNRSYYSWVLRSVWEMLRHVRVRNLRGHLRFGTWRPDITGVIGGVFWTILSPDEQGFDLEPDFYMTKSEPGTDSDMTDHDAETVDQLLKLDADFDFYGHFRFYFAALLALRIACSRDTWMMLKKYRNRRRQNNG